MFVSKFTSCAAAATLAALLSVGPTKAAMYPALQYGSPTIQHVDCAVGMHVGPLGTCILGGEDRAEHPDRVIIERRAVDEGCQSKTVHKEDGMGDSETKTKTNCN